MGGRRLSEKETGAMEMSNRSAEERRLSWMSLFQADASSTNWCGLGSHLTETDCPAPDANRRRYYDYKADLACRRHDHAVKFENLGYANRLSCDVDDDLAKDGGHNGAVAAVFGSWGVAQAWGCIDTGSYNCWKSGGRRRWLGWVSYGKHCNGEHVLYGPNRYQTVQHRYGYKDKGK